ncbi:hypothetical protein [Kribbella sp. DT2]|uniref:hypothetical protein n=1 Tax=Kribbella sp. DT2 TaxID=3393427 RepID=UPI003CE7A4B0
MSEFVVAPLEEPTWSVSAEEFAAALRARWPGVRVEVGAVEGSSMALEALIPEGEGGWELGIALSGTGQAVTLEPADLEGAAEFAVWFVETVVPGQVGLHLMEPGSMRSVELVAGMTPADVCERLGQQ